jgi:YHS domain-containing protein
MFVFIFRLIVFLIAISVIRSVVVRVQGWWYAIQSGRRAVPPGRRGQAPATMLQMDPVCGTYVAVDSSFKKVAGGKVYHFCSAECRNRFAA